MPSIRLGRAATAAALLAVAMAASAAHAGEARTIRGVTVSAVPVLDQKCDTNRDMAHLAETVRNGRGVAGTWTLRPTFTCSEAELRLSVRATLARNRTTLLTSAGTCSSSTTPNCDTVAGAVKSIRLGTNVRGTYVIHVTVTLTGPDAALFSNCDYDAPTLTATCTADSSPIVVR